MRHFNRTGIFLRQKLVLREFCLLIYLAAPQAAAYFVDEVYK